MNGTSDSLTRHHVTSYECGGNAMTNEYVSDGLGTGACGSGTCSYDNMALDASTETRPDNTLGSGAYTFWVRYQSEPSAKWSNNMTVPYTAQTNTIDWKNSSGGDHAILNSQFELNNSGTNDIYSTVALGSAFNNPLIGDFSLATGSPACNTGLQVGAMNDRSTPNIGYSQNTCTTESAGSLSSIAVATGTPNASQFGFTTVAVGQYLAFAVTGTYADGTQRSIPASSVTWTSSVPADASVSSRALSYPAPNANGGVATKGTFGVVTGLATGTTTITAAYGGQTAPLSITVTAGTAIPVASPAAGTYTSTQTVTLTTTTSGATIYYTTDGSTPTTSSAVYSSPLTVASTETINAIASLSGTTSQVGSFAYTIMGTVATPTFSPIGGTYTTAQSVTLATTTSGAAIYYCVTSTTCTPTTSSTHYTGPILVSTSTNIYAFAVESGFTNSAISNASYTISATTGVIITCPGQITIKNMLIP